MNDATSHLSIVPPAPVESWRFAKVERFGVNWYWDQVALWWPTAEMLDYYRLGLPDNRLILKDALSLRDFYISMLASEQGTGGTNESRREDWQRLRAGMLQNRKKLAEAKKQKKREWILASAIVGIIMLGFAGCTGLISSAGSTEDGELAKITAQNLCEGMVTKHLKSPSTANFSEERTIGSDPITVTGYVDSENSFGATLRSTFHCTGTPQGAGVSTTLDSLTQQ